MSVDLFHQATITELFNLYHNYGNTDYIGEKVSQTEHMVLAAMCAEKDLDINYPERDQIILAAFLHDIGHLLGFRDKLNQMDEWGTEDHDLVGGRYLRSLGFPELVCILVEKHVQAKRYLVTIQPEYYHSLSEASKETLKYQGGRMTDQELYDFENDKYKNVYIKFRRWEEQAKVSPNMLHSLKKYKDLCCKVLSTHHQSQSNKSSVAHN